MSNVKRSPRGTRKTTLSLTHEVREALEHIRQTSDQGETTSHFVDTWVRQHPRIRQYLIEQQHEKGKEDRDTQINL